MKLTQLQKETKMTIFLTTHYIEEAADSDYVVVMKEGQIIAKGTPEQLKNNYSSHQLTITTNQIDELSACLITQNIKFKVDKSLFHIQLDSTTNAIPILSNFAHLIRSFEVRQSSLDDVFITITRKDLNEDVSVN